MTDQFEFTSRYAVLGPPNGCTGDCGGTGFIPHYESTGPVAEGCRPVPSDDDPPIYRVLWFLLEAKRPPVDGYHFIPDDGWHFLPCPQCKPDNPLVKLAWAFMGKGPAESDR